MITHKRSTKPRAKRLEKSLNPFMERISVGHTADDGTYHYWSQAHCGGLIKVPIACPICNHVGWELLEASNA